MRVFRRQVSAWIVVLLTLAACNDTNQSSGDQLRVDSNCLVVERWSSRARVLRVSDDIFVQVVPLPSLIEPWKVRSNVAYIDMLVKWGYALLNSEKINIGDSLDSQYPGVWRYDVAPVNSKHRSGYKAALLYLQRNDTVCYPACIVYCPDSGNVVLNLDFVGRLAIERRSWYYTDGRNPIHQRFDINSQKMLEMDSLSIVLMDQYFQSRGLKVWDVY